MPGATIPRSPDRGRATRRRRVIGVLVGLVFLVAMPGAVTARPQTLRIPTPFVEDGANVSLEVVIFAPAGEGPFPTLIFNHGSTGIGNDPTVFGRTWTSDAVVRVFNERGWLVAFPQRRGRGASGGRYDEGLEPDRSRYSCTPSISLAGLDRAMSDLDAATGFLAALPQVDATRLVVGGQSRGGILSVVYAGTRPGRFRAALNFVGGWMSDRCADPRAINTVTFRRAAASPLPTLWLYAENDPFYSLRHSRANFDAFTSADGTGTFLAYRLPAGENGHLLIRHPDQWRRDVESFIERID